MNLYVILNLAVLALPLLLSFDRRVAYFRRWPSVLVSIAVVGLVYLAWDVLATARGVWWFNQRFAGGSRIAGLPIGEILFFTTVPFSCLFVYEVIGAYGGDKVWRIPRLLWLILAGVLILGAVVYRAQPYTLWVLLAAAGFLLVALLTPLLARRQFWIYMAISAVAFLITNGVLTALPVVGYSEAAIWGARVYTIPVEDFFYCFSLLGFNVLLHSKLRGRLSLAPKVPGERVL